jgi:hypothetical protein
MHLVENIEFLEYGIEMLLSIKVAVIAARAVVIVHPKKGYAGRQDQVDSRCTSLSVN